MILPTIHPPHHFPAKVATSKSCCSSSMVWLQGASPSHFWISTNPSSKHPGFPFPKKKNLHPKQKLRNAFHTWHLCILLSMRGPWLRLPGWIRSSFCPGTKNVRAWIAPLVLILSKNTTCEDLWCFNLFGTQNSWRRLYYNIHPYLRWLEVKLPRVEGELYGRQEGS